MKPHTSINCDNCATFECHTIAKKQKLKKGVMGPHPHEKDMWIVEEKNSMCDVDLKGTIMRTMPLCGQEACKMLG